MTIHPSFLLHDQQQPAGAEQEGVTEKFKSYRQLKLNAFQKETQDITLTTEEGDKVTISSLSEVKSQYMAFDYTSQLKGASESAQGEKFSASSKNAFQISVEGDLNEEELEDIKSVVGQLDDIMQDLVSGDLDEAMSDALGILDDTETITSLNATLQFQQRVSMEQRSVSQLSRTGSPGPFIPRDGENQGRPGNLQHPSQGGPLNSGGFGGFDSFSNIVAEITGKMMDIIEKSDAEPIDLKEPINKMFSGILEQLAADSPENDLKSKLVEQLNSELIDKLDASLDEQMGEPLDEQLES
ncbi:MAG: hypothetical protein GY757_55745 [bacterium]|nr:hypothetical protein [bacterium]